MIYIYIYIYVHIHVHINMCGRADDRAAFERLFFLGLIPHEVSHFMSHLCLSSLCCFRYCSLQHVWVEDIPQQVGLTRLAGSRRDLVEKVVPSSHLAQDMVETKACWRCAVRSVRVSVYCNVLHRLTWHRIALYESIPYTMTV